MMAVILGFMAVVIDGGHFLLTKRSLQGDVDAAAMAGVRELPNSQTLASAAARDYAENRNDTGAQVSSITYTGNDTIKVDVHKVTPGAFMGLLGISSPDITATATAKVSQISGIGKMLPFGVMRDAYTISSPPSGMQIREDNSSRRGLVLPTEKPNCTKTTGGDDVGDLIKTSAHGGNDACAMAVGSTIETAPGWKTGPVGHGFEDRLGSNAQTLTDVFELDPVSGRYLVKDKNSPRIGVIPIIENLDGTTEWSNKTKDAKILGYLMVYIGDPAQTVPDNWGDGKDEVYLTPMRTILPEDLDNEITFSNTFDTTSPAPVAYRLVQ